MDRSIALAIRKFTLAPLMAASILELITFLCGVITLRRSSVKETMLMIVIEVAAALLLRLVIPFHFQ